MASRMETAAVGFASFRRGCPALAGYFAPGIVHLLKYPDLDSKQVMREFGAQVGGNPAAKPAHPSLDQALAELANVWLEHRIGTLTLGGVRPPRRSMKGTRVPGDEDSSPM